jgi:hypothetical protein
MAMVVVILPEAETPTSFRPAVLSELAGLGITSVSVVRDDSLVGLVLEGWTFDEERSSEAIEAVVAAPGPSVRTLRPLLQMGVSQARQKGGVS